MTPDFRKIERIRIFTRHCTYFKRYNSSASSFNGELYSSTELRSADLREGIRGTRRCRGKAWISSGSSLSLSRLYHSSSNCSLCGSHSQVQTLLPYTSSLHPVQETLLKGTKNLATSLVTGQNLLRGVLDLNFQCYRVFSSVTSDNYGTDTDDELQFDDSCTAETENGSVDVNSTVDTKEVERVCKVIDELFALDRNMEAVLDECRINLSHDLVIEVLKRFRHARKPAFRFFSWAGEKPWFSHNSITYNAMMDILGKTRQFETMMSILEEMGAKGLLTIDTFKIAMNAFAAAKERKKAVAIFELMKKYKFKVGVNTVNCLLDSLGREKLGKEAQALFDKLKNRFTPNLMTYTVLVNGWCRLRNLMEAGRVWNDMIDKGFKPDIVAHNTMLQGLIRCKKNSDAIKLFVVMKAKGPSPNVRSYTIMIRDFCKQSKMKEAIEYFDEMLESGYPPDAAIYTCLITGFGNLKKMDIVLQLLNEMQARGCPPDGHTYNALIKLMTSQKMPDDAARIYKKLIQNGIEPSIHTYNMMIKSYFQVKNYETGRAVWDEMIKKGCCPDDNSYTVLIGGLISQGRSGEACKYLEEMIEKGMKAPQIDYIKLAADCSRVGKPDMLEELAQKMKFDGKFEASNVFARWAQFTKKRVKRRVSMETG